MNHRYYRNRTNVAALIGFAIGFVTGFIALAAIA